MKEIILKDNKGNSYIMYGAFSKQEKKVQYKLSIFIQEQIKDLSFVEAANLLFPVIKN